MNTEILYTKPLADNILENVKAKVLSMDIKPHLAVVLVEGNLASEVYVKRKKQAAEQTGIKCTIHRLKQNSSQEQLEKKLEELNLNSGVTGIILQLPLPDQFKKFQAINTILPSKDVDGLTATNVGKLELNQDEWQTDGILPATPLGVMRLLKWAKVELCGLNVTVIGRSNLVGRPLASLLAQENATVTMCHKETKDINEHIKNADLIITAAGCPNLIDASSPLKEGVMLIDVGINQIGEEATTGKRKLVGDMNFEEIVASGKAKFITPVPGGVGPMTVATLLSNVVDATLV